MGCCSDAAPDRGEKRGVCIDTGEATYEAERVELIRPHFTN